MKNIHKSLTVQIATIGAVLMGFISLHPEYVKQLISMYVSQYHVNMVYDFIIYIVGAKTIGGVAYGRTRKAPPLETRK